MSARPSLRIAAVLALALLGNATGITGPARPAQAQIIEKDLHRGVAESPIKLDPQFATLPAEKAILSDLFAGLVAEDPTGEIVPGAAESWDVSGDGLTWTFLLREGLKWTDTRPVVAGDFVYAFQRLLAPRSGAPFASMFYNIAGAEALNRDKASDARDLGVRAKDDRTVVFTLNRRSPEFLAQLAHHSAFPLRRDLVERDDTWTRPGKMVSNGAYTLAEWLPGRHLKLAKNWDFYDAPEVRIDNVYYEVVDVPDNGVDKFFGGDLDIYSDLPRELAGELLRSAPGSMRVYPTLTVDYLVFNTTKPPFDDPRVRQALALAVDKQRLVSRVLQDGEIPARQFLPLGLAGIREPAKPKRDGPYPMPRPVSASENRERALDILTNIGLGARDAWGAGTPVRLILSFNASDSHQKVAEAIASMWEKIGVRVDLYSADYNVHYGDLGAADFEIARAGWIADFNDPVAFLMLFRSTIERFNYGRFADEEFDKLMSLAERQPPEARPVTLYRAAERIRELYPVVPLYHHASRHLVGRQVTGWQDNVRDIHPTRYLDIVEPAPEPEPQETAPVREEAPPQPEQDTVQQPESPSPETQQPAVQPVEAVSPAAPPAQIQPEPEPEPEETAAPPRPPQRGE